MELSRVIVLDPVCVVCKDWFKVVDFSEGLSVILGCGCSKKVYFSWNGYDLFNDLNPVEKTLVLAGFFKPGTDKKILSDFAVAHNLSIEKDLLLVQLGKLRGS